MDYVERALFNTDRGLAPGHEHQLEPERHLLPAADAGQPHSYGNTGTCCGGTGMENHTKHQESAYFHSPTTLGAVGQPLRPDHARLARARLHRRAGDRLPAPGVDQARSSSGGGQLNLKLRVPYWATKGYTVKLNGAVQDAQRQAELLRVASTARGARRHGRDRHAVHDPHRARDRPPGHAVDHVRPAAVPDPRHAAGQPGRLPEPLALPATSSSTATTRARRSPSRRAA